MTQTKVKRIMHSIEECNVVINKELKYQPQFRDQTLLDIYREQRNKLTNMLAK